MFGMTNASYSESPQGTHIMSIILFRAVPASESGISFPGRTWG